MYFIEYYTESKDIEWMYGMVASVFVVYLSDCVWLTASLSLTSIIKSIILLITSSEMIKVQNSMYSLYSNLLLQNTKL